MVPGEEQGLGDALAWKQDTMGQKHADIGIAAARGPAGILQTELTGETLDYYQEVCVDNT